MKKQAIEKVWQGISERENDLAKIFCWWSVEIYAPARGISVGENSALAGIKFLSVY